jgi:hypothetical protein
MTTTHFTPSRPWWRAVRHGAVVLMAAASMLGTAACGASDSSTGPRNADPTGLYSLRQVGRDAIPAEIFRGTLGGVPGITVAVTGGELVLQDDARFYLALDFELRANGEAFPRSQSVEGEYEIDGGQLMLVADGSPGGTRATLRDGVIGLPLDVLGDGTTKHYNFRYVP